MYQMKQFEDSLHQFRQSFNSMVSQINQQLNTLEMLTRNMSNQQGQQYTGYGSPQHQPYTVSGQSGGYSSQFQSQPGQGGQFAQGSRYNPENQYLGGNQYSGENQYSQRNQHSQGAQYNQGTQHSQGNQYSQGTQYSGGDQYRQANINPVSGLSEDEPTLEQQSGVNRYGADYSSENDRGK